MVTEISNPVLIEIADQVARDFQILLGTTTIPLLLRSEKEEIKMTLNKNRKYTGKILVDLSNKDCCIMQLEYIEEDRSSKKNTKKIEAIELIKAELTHEVIPYLLKLSINEHVEFIQMFDTSLLLNNAAFDDSTVMECVLEKIGEWEQYLNAMAIFDVDSLIGVTENMSDSSMGQSSSYSIANHKLWHQVVIQTANSKLDSSIGRDHKWVVVISKNDFICKQFKTLTRFPLTDAEEKENENNNKDRTCINCEIGYTNSKNNIDSCNYHDGQLIDTRAAKTQIIALDKKNLYKCFLDSNTEDRQNILKNFVFLCCFQAYNSAGCKKAFHSDENDNRNYKKYEKYIGAKIV